MTRIRVLPEVLANQIAAGEIIERPASVVKELLENSLDAKAGQITVEVAHGGRQLMRIRDDGEGLSHDDAILAFEHHATSKISDSQDLFAIATLGFRGEALPSIASVSRLTLRSLDALREQPDCNVGTEVIIHGGTIRSVKNIPWPQGTEITVQDLFFNVPARKKFLKSNPTELGHIVRLVTQYAVAFQEVAFKLIHDGRRLLDCTVGRSLEERLHQVLGRQVVENLIPFDASGEGHRVSGFASRPHEHRNSGYAQYLYVNRRMVRDRAVSHAVRQAYGSALPQGAYPVLVAFIEAPAEEVDVNVHPAKTEVRFRNPELVHRLVREAIERTLLLSKPVPRFSVPKEEISEPLNLRSEPIAEHQKTEPFWSKPAILTDFPPTPEKLPLQDNINPEWVDQPPVDISDIPIFNEHIDKYSSSVLTNCGKLPVKDQEALQKTLENTALGLDIRSLRPIGHLSNTYILAGCLDGLVIIDQHVAHERILFERFLQQFRSEKIAIQKLLIPLTFDLTPSQHVALDKIQTGLIACGFEISDFGGGTISVSAVPAGLEALDCHRLIVEIIENSLENPLTSGLDSFHRFLAASLACRSAVKANTQLNHDKMLWLLSELSSTKFPHACPHGRPILLRLTLREIEKRFLRV